MAGPEIRRQESSEESLAGKDSAQARMRNLCDQTRMSRIDFIILSAVFRTAMFASTSVAACFCLTISPAKSACGFCATRLALASKRFVAEAIPEAAMEKISLIE